MFSKVVTLQNSVCETELMPPMSLNSNASGTTDIHEKEDITKTRKSNLFYKPKTFSKKEQLLFVNTHDKVEELCVEAKSVDATVTRKKKKIKKVASEVTATPAKPTESLPSDLRDSIESNGKPMSTSIKVENNLQSLEKPFADRVRSTVDIDNVMKLPEGCPVYIKEELIIDHLPSQAYYDDEWQMDDMIQPDAYNATSETNVEYSEQNQLSIPMILNMKRKRGRPRKIINNCQNQNTPNESKDDDVSQQTPNTATESMPRSKRRASKIAVSTDISNSSDESDNVNTVENKSVKNQPADKERHRGRGRGRGRPRGRSRGRGITQNFSDGSQRQTINDSKLSSNEITTAMDFVDVSVENAAKKSDTTKEVNYSLIYFINPRFTYTYIKFSVET